MATLQELINAVDALGDSVTELTNEVGIRKSLLDSSVASASSSQVAAAASATQSTSSATQAAASATQAVNAAASATAVAFGGATGLDGIFPTAWIRPQQTVLGSRLTITRSGLGGTFIDGQRRLRGALPNTARFDYDLSTGRPLGVLVETAKTNLVLRSNNLENAYWSKTAYTISKTLTGLRGNANEATRITNDSGAGNIFATITGLTANTQYTFSFFARNNGGTNAYIGVRDEGTLAFTARNFGSEIVNTEFRRISISFTTGASTTSARVYVARDQTNVDWIFQDAQLEVGGLSSYIGETAGTTVTRNADDDFLQNINTWNPVEGTIVVRVRSNIIDSSIFLAWDQTVNNQFQLRSTGLLRYVANGQIQTINSGNSGIGVFDTWAISYTPTRVAISRNGNAVQSISISQSALINQIYLSFTGVTGAGISQSKHIHTYEYYPKAATDLGLITRSNPNLYYGIGDDDLATLNSFADLAFTRREDLDVQAGRTPESFRWMGRMLITRCVTTSLSPSKS